MSECREIRHELLQKNFLCLRAMAFCSEAERLFAVKCVEEISVAAGFEYHEIYDKLFEGVRHSILEAAAVLWESEAENLFALRDLLTSLKYDSGECILSGQVRQESMSFQDAMRLNKGYIKEIRASSRLLATVTLPVGAARTSLIWLQTQHRLAYEDRVCLLLFARRFRFSSESSIDQVLLVAILACAVAYGLSGSRWLPNFGSVFGFPGYKS